MSKKPKRALKKNTPKIQPEAKVSEKEKSIKAEPPSSVEAKPKKKGWWSR